MKMPASLTLSAISLACTLTGCASTLASKQEAAKVEPPKVQTIASPTPEVKDSQKIASQGKIEQASTIDVPPWYIKAPASTDEYMFITGTGVSSDMAMSRAKAMLDAQNQLAAKLNAVVDSVTRQRKVDSSGVTTSDYTSQSIRKTVAETSITGFHLEDSRVQPENRGYRTFVLLRYPVGDANKLRQEKLQQERENKKLSDEEEIDKDLGKKKVSEATTESNLAQTKVTPVVAPSLTVVEESKPVPVNQLKLLEVENEEYKKRRAEALQKPGAVVGRITLQ